MGISQATLSRQIRRLGDGLVIAGRARATRYAARRTIPEVGQSVPLFSVDLGGVTHRVATLHAVAPRGYWVEPAATTFDARFHDDLPYFLHDLRPAGYLGRLVPTLHLELELPADILRWSGDDCMRYLARVGWDLPGSLIAGDAPLALYLEHVRAAPAGVDPDRRAAHYLALADDLAALAPPGSSAAGEQPKLLATRAPDNVPVLVKFSPPAESPVGRRWADLLVCEHVAHEVLRRHGLQAPKSELVGAGGRTFLEVERFDRTPAGGRRGVISLLALDLEHVGSTKPAWQLTAAALRRQRRIDGGAERTIRRLDLFGRLIANSDMHPGNVSFFADGERLREVAPVYDMVPMLLAPLNDRVVERHFVPPTPAPADADIWEDTWTAAVEFWESVALHPGVSPDFAAIARLGGAEVRRLEAIGRMLPR